MLERIMGVFALNPQTFNEIENDQTATTQAAIVVALVALAGMLGSLITSLLGSAFAGDMSGMGSTFLSLIIGFVLTFVNWFIWSAVTYFVGTSLFNGTADMGEMLRVIGFAYAPRILVIIPCIGWIVGLIWSLIAGVIGIREALDFDTGKAIATALIGWIIIFVIQIILSVIGIGGAIGLGAVGGFLAN
jgi:hypothetical protein